MGVGHTRSKERKLTLHNSALFPSVQLGGVWLSDGIRSLARLLFVYIRNLAVMISFGSVFSFGHILL